jgi:hypothetical protein
MPLCFFTLEIADMAAVDATSDVPEILAKPFYSQTPSGNGGVIKIVTASSRFHLSRGEQMPR